MVGCCLDALNPAGAPDPAVLVEHGIDGGRLVAFRDPAFYAYHDTLSRSGLKTAVVLARETFGDDDYAAVARELAGWCSPTYWVLGNEGDAYRLPVPSPSSWSMTPPEYAGFWTVTATAILDVQPDAKLLIGGLVSGDPTYLGELLPLDPAPYGADVHPYSKGPDDAQNLLDAYAEILRSFGL